MAKAKHGDRVEVHYEGTLDNGTTFDSSGGSGRTIYGPTELVIGLDWEFHPKFQEAIVGLEPGESVKVRIACEEAYGPRFEEMVHEVPLSEVRPKEEVLEEWRWVNGKGLKEWAVNKGDMLEVPIGPDGELVAVLVTGVTDTTVTFDANHPLAGQDLNYEIRLVNILP